MAAVISVGFLMDPDGGYDLGMFSIDSDRSYDFCLVCYLIVIDFTISAVVLIDSDGLYDFCLFSIEPLCILYLLLVN